MEATNKKTERERLMEELIDYEKAYFEIQKTGRYKFTVVFNTIRKKALMKRCDTCKGIFKKGQIIFARDIFLDLMDDDEICEFGMEVVK